MPLKFFLKDLKESVIKALLFSYKYLKTYTVNNKKHLSLLKTVLKINECRFIVNW